MNARIRQISALCVLTTLAWPAVAYDRLLIITPAEFANEVEPLARHKEASGRVTFVETLDSIYATYGGVDEPEQVKRCIVDYEQNQSVNQVLLVGDTDKFPTRWTFWGGDGAERFHITDLYYADLYADGTTNFETWDTNGNQLYSEIEFAPDGFINNDAVDYLPDVAVGRIAASSGDEVTAYVNKVIAYELRTRPDDGWFNTIGLYTGTWISGHNARSDEIDSSMSSLGFTSIKRYADWTDPNDAIPPPGTPGVIVDDFNAGMGFVSYMGHGNVGCWSCVGFCQSTLDQATNAHMLPVATGVACDTGQMAWRPGSHPYVDVFGVDHCGYEFGEDLDPGPYPHPNFPRPAPIQSGVVSCPGWCEDGNCDLDRSCFGEALQLGNPLGMTGAIAYLGARSNGQRNADEAIKFFYDGYVVGHRSLGGMWKHMIEQYYDYYDLGNSHTWWYTSDNWAIGHDFDEARKLILFGDPSLIVGGAFRNMQSGSVWDGGGGPWWTLGRYRVVGDVTIPAGETLTVYPSASVLVEPGHRITGLGASAAEGLQVSTTSSEPTYFLSQNVDPASDDAVRGMVIKGELRVYNGGELVIH